MVYKRIWIPVSEALRYIQTALNGTLAEAVGELSLALFDGAVKSRWATTGEEIDPTAWRDYVIIGDTGKPEWESNIIVRAQSAEVCGADMLRLWGPMSTAARLNDAGSPIHPASSDCDSAEPCRDVGRSTPPAIKAPNEPTAWKPRKRGPDPVKREAVERLILDDIRSGYTTLKKLGNETKKKAIYFRYRDIPGFEEPVSRDVVTRALLKVLEGDPAS